MHANIKALQDFIATPANVKRAAQSLVAGFLAGRAAISGEEGLNKSAAAKPHLLDQASQIVERDVSLRVALFSPAAA